MLLGAQVPLWWVVGLACALLPALAAIVVELVLWARDEIMFARCMRLVDELAEMLAYETSENG